MSAAHILQQIGLTPSRVGELCERYGHAVPAKPKPPERDLRGCRFHRLVRLAQETEGGVQ